MDSYGKLNLLGFVLALVLRELVEDLSGSRNVARVTYVVFFGAWLACTYFIRRKQERAKKP